MTKNRNDTSHLKICQEGLRFIQYELSVKGANEIEYHDCLNTLLDENIKMEKRV